MDIDSLHKKVESALLGANVQNIRQVLSGVVGERMSAPDPRCSILFLLAEGVTHLLSEWERTSSEYLDAVVSAESAAAKATADLHRVRNATSGEFNGALGDFFAEMSIVVALAKRGYSEFKPFPTTKTKSFDYKCRKGGAEACLECKNIRAPITLFDTFSRVMIERRRVHPSLQSMNLVLRIYSDNTVTDEQAEAIDTFITLLGTGETPPPVLMLPGDVPVEISIQEGHGTTMLFRSMGADDVTPYVDHEKFIAKIRDTVRKGVAQLAVCPESVQVLGMNIMSPDATIPSGWFREIRDCVNAESCGRVACEITFHYGYLSAE